MLYNLLKYRTIFFFFCESIYYIVYKKLKNTMDGIRCILRVINQDN